MLRTSHCHSERSKPHTASHRLQWVQVLRAIRQRRMLCIHRTQPPPLDKRQSGSARSRRPLPHGRHLERRDAGLGPTRCLHNASKNIWARHSKLHVPPTKNVLTRLDHRRASRHCRRRSRQHHGLTGTWHLQRPNQAHATRVMRRPNVWAPCRSRPHALGHWMRPQPADT